MAFPSRSEQRRWLYVLEEGIPAPWHELCKVKRGVVYGKSSDGDIGEEREVSFLWTQISPWQTKDLLYSENTAPTPTPPPPTKHFLTTTEFKILVNHSSLFVSRDMPRSACLATSPFSSLSLFFFCFANKLSLEKQKSFFFSWIDLQCGIRI